MKTLTLANWISGFATLDLLLFIGFFIGGIAYLGFKNPGLKKFLFHIVLAILAVDVITGVIVPFEPVPWWVAILWGAAFVAICVWLASKVFNLRYPITRSFS